MTSKHPFSILLLFLLAAGVLAASVSTDEWRSGSLLRVCEVEDVLEEQLEDASEEEIDFGFDAIDPPVSRIVRAIHPNRPIDRSCDGYRHIPVLCSFGWMLPLRI